ncbi:hypothetical protein [Lacipirellula sp.]|uniref:hypothetical protein n=1 Tax=Lacipirellula sp. TaxID=2691419 RepID=UPI003D140E46
MLDRAAESITGAATLSDFQEARSLAESARIYVKAAKLGLQLHNRAAELKLRAERKAGAALARLPLQGGDRRSKGRAASLKLESLGITRDQSKRWQLAATVPDGEFEQYIRNANRSGKELSTAGLLRLAQSRKGSQEQVNSRGIALGAGGRTSGHSRSEAAVVLDEIGQHRDLLASLLGPICESGAAEGLRPIERRHILQLLNEMGLSIEELKRWL